MDYSDEEQKKGKMFIFSWDELALEGSPEQHEGDLARNVTAKKNEKEKSKCKALSRAKLSE